MKLARKLAEGMLTAVVVVCLIGFILWLSLPRFMGWQPQVVLSGSMEPALQVGAVAFVEEKPAEEVEVGDVLTFWHPQTSEVPRPLVTHRVVNIVTDPDGRPAFETRGDANDGPDPWTVPAPNVVGTVKFDVPYVGQITERVRSPLGFLLIVGIPALYIASGEIRSVASEVRRALARRQARRQATP